jgi:hypothetical protein
LCGVWSGGLGGGGGGGGGGEAVLKKATVRCGLLSINFSHFMLPRTYAYLPSTHRDFIVLKAFICRKK